MRGPLAIDFGNSSTVIAIWTDGQARTVQLRPYSHLYKAGDQSIALIPSIIHFADNNEPVIGYPVIESKEFASPGTIRSFRAYLAYSHGVALGDRTVTYEEAARTFISKILQECKSIFGGSEFPVVLTAPIDSFESYTSWLADICREMGLTDVRFIDEPAAAALSFGCKPKQGEVYLLFDFSSSKLELSLVKFECDLDAVSTGKHCRLLAKQAVELGGDEIDKWLLNYLLTTNKMHKDSFSADEQSSLLVTVRACKEELSWHDSSSLKFAAQETTLTRHDLEDLLQQQNFYSILSRTIDKILTTARDEHEIDTEAISGVFMVGGSSLIPSVQDSIRTQLGDLCVHAASGLDTLARGAAAYAAGNNIFDYIQHDYAIYHNDRETGEPAFEIIVKKGTSYPSSGPLATKTITACQYNQTRFKILISQACTEEQPFSTSQPASSDLDEIFGKQDGHVIKYRLLNRKTPFVIETDRPVQKGEKALELAFSLDVNKNLVVDSYVLHSGRKVPHRTNDPVVCLR